MWQEVDCFLELLGLLQLFFFDAFDARSLRHFLKDQLYSDLLPQPPIVVMSPVDTPEGILKFLGRNKLRMNFWPILRGVSGGR